MAEKRKASKSKMYSVEGGSVKRLRPTCPRCGPGVFMAEHEGRLSCGRCGYAEFKK